MVRFHVQGLCVVVLKNDSLDVLMMNSGGRKTAAPFHLQSVFVLRDHLDKASTTAAPLPTISYRWFPTSFDNEWLGWSVPGCRGVVGAGAVGPTTSASTVVTGTQHPSSAVNTDWSDLYWVLQSKKLLPGCALKKECFTPGDLTLSILTFKGGAVEGGNPVDPQGSQWIWSVTPGYEQAFTSTIDIVYAAETPALELFDGLGTSLGTVAVQDGGEIYIINDAPVLDAQRSLPSGFEATGDGCADDLQMFKEFFSGPPYIKNLVKPVPVRNWVTGKQFDSPHCSALLVDLR